MLAILSRAQCVIEIPCMRCGWYDMNLLTIGNLNSLAPGKFEWNFRHVIFKQILVIDSWGISCEIALIWMSLDFTDDQSTLVQVMAWCRQATNHCLSQYWPRSLSPYGVIRPQWVNQNSTKPNKTMCMFYGNTIFMAQCKTALSPV